MTSIVEKPSSEKSKSVIKKTTICHCRTNMNFNEFIFQWTFLNFSKLSTAFSTILASGITDSQNFSLCATFDRKENFTMSFYSLLMANHQKIKVNYLCYVEHSLGALYKDYRVYDTYLTHNKMIYKLSVDELKRQNCLDNNILRVHFYFEIIENILHHIMQETINESEEYTINNSILEQKSGLKVSFVIDKKSLSIDRDILCSKSKFFENFLLDNEKKVKKIEIYDVTYDVFKHFISYLETGSLKDSLGSLGLNDITLYTKLEYYRSRLDSNYVKFRQMLHDLIVVANKYNVQDLLLLCEKFLIKTMYKLNAIDDLEIAYLNNAQFLEKYAIRFIKLHIDDFAKIIPFQDLVIKYPKLLYKIKNENLNCQKVSFKVEDYPNPDYIKSMSNNFAY
ncbi:uncharacterized protein LOC126853103 [Cataglyphis hispanica]|uniref:uncharacterized protein LOC126853103 n=1 Tax=Cataglyphis hispanica TaxID=1086592 RepID=UPI00217FF907|nr:uncharacterized protein LOC126853103 [Cataglyphis hispanica]